MFEAGSGKRLLFFLMVFGCVRGRFLEGCSGGCFGRSSFLLEVLMCGFVLEFSRGGISRWFFVVRRRVPGLTFGDELGTGCSGTGSGGHRIS